jgi:hypothetical protein
VSQCSSCQEDVALVGPVAIGIFEYPKEEDRSIQKDHGESGSLFALFAHLSPQGLQTVIYVKVNKESIKSKISIGYETNPSGPLLQGFLECSLGVPQSRQHSLYSTVFLGFRMSVNTVGHVPSGRITFRPRPLGSFVTICSEGLLDTF